MCRGVNQRTNIYTFLDPKSAVESTFEVPTGPQKLTCGTCAGVDPTFCDRGVLRSIVVAGATLEEDKPLPRERDKPGKEIKSQASSHEYSHRPPSVRTARL